MQEVSFENSQLTESGICEWIFDDEEHLSLQSDESDSEKEVVRT